MSETTDSDGCTAASKRSERAQNIFFEPADNYNGYFAFLYTGNVSSYHVVDTTTFDTSLSAPNNFEGHAASKGSAETLCGRDLFGHIMPLEQDRKSTQGICGTCLRSLQSREVDK